MLAEELGAIQSTLRLTSARSRETLVFLCEDATPSPEPYSCKVLSRKLLGRRTEHPCLRCWCCRQPATSLGLYTNLGVQERDISHDRVGHALLHIQRAMVAVGGVPFASLLSGLVKESPYVLVMGYQQEQPFSLLSIASLQPKLSTRLYTRNTDWLDLVCLTNAVSAASGASRSLGDLDLPPTKDEEGLAADTSYWVILWF